MIANADFPIDKKYTVDNFCYSLWGTDFEKVAIVPHSRRIKRLMYGSKTWTMKVKHDASWTELNPAEQHDVWVYADRKEEERRRHRTIGIVISQPGD